MCLLFTVSPVAAAGLCTSKFENAASQSVTKAAIIEFGFMEKIKGGSEFIERERRIQKRREEEKQHRDPGCVRD